MNEFEWVVGGVEMAANIWPFYALLLANAKISNKPSCDRLVILKGCLMSVRIIAVTLFVCVRFLLW